LKTNEQYKSEAESAFEYWKTYDFWESEEQINAAYPHVRKLQQASEAYEEAAEEVKEYKQVVGEKRTLAERQLDFNKKDEFYNTLEIIKADTDKEIKALKELANIPTEETMAPAEEESGAMRNFKAQIPTPSKFSGKPSECTTAWLRQWKQQVEDYFYLIQLVDNDQQMVFLPNCLEEGAKKFYYGFRALHGPKISAVVKKEEKGKEKAETSDGEWNLNSFFKALKEVYIPVNHIQDQMDEWANIKQAAPGQPKQIKDIAIRIQQLADDIDDGKTIGWKQRIMKLLDAMRPELHLRVEPEVDLSPESLDEKSFAKVAQIATKHDRIMHQLGGYPNGKSRKETLAIHPTKPVRNQQEERFKKQLGRLPQQIRR
jgi:hypothetical protein